MTELDAINIMLANVGESPVSELDVNNPEIGLASITLNQVLREVCGEGWAFNTEHSYPLTPDQDGNIFVPTDALRITGSRDECYQSETTIRDGRLYDKRNHTYTFSGTVYVDLVWQYRFEDLPAPFQDYVAQRAARVHTGRSQGNTALLAAASIDEERLRNNCLAWDTQNRRPNMLDTTARYPVMRPYRPADAVWRI